VHASLRADEGGIRDLGLARAAAREAEGSNSRYDDPEAVGMRPVLRTETLTVSYVVVNIRGSSKSIQIFLSSEGCRWRWARSAAPVPDSDSEAKTAGLVPPGGPLTRLRSAIMVVSEAKTRSTSEMMRQKRKLCLAFALFALAPLATFFSISSLPRFLFLPHSCVVYTLG
jgi:hypothetical protein